MALLSTGARDECVRDLLSVAFRETLGRAVLSAARPTADSLLRRPIAASDGDVPYRIEGKILCDDPGHQHDVVVRFEEALVEELRCDASVIQELEEELARAGLSLRSWIRTKFFEQHLSRYSMFRRKAPIFWQLATPSASYSVWLCVHSLSNDTLFKVQSDFAMPKLSHEERKLQSMRQEFGDDPKAGERKLISDQEAFVEELRAFVEEVKRVAPLWRPSLADGVVINFSLLWRLVPHNKVWQKELKATWDSLCAGNLDWAALAMHLWPERLIPKCAMDRSLAIAHGLEDNFWTRDHDGKVKPRHIPIRPEVDIVSERTSAAIQAALKDVIAAPTARARVGRRGARVAQPPEGPADALLV